jgi:hypothetical protein
MSAVNIYLYVYLFAKESRHLQTHEDISGGGGLYGAGGWIFFEGGFVVFYWGYWKKRVAERGALMVNLWWNAW